MPARSNLSAQEARIQAQTDAQNRAAAEAKQRENAVASLIAQSRRLSDQGNYDGWAEVRSTTPAGNVTWPIN